MSAQPLIIGHRGDSAHAPENTLIAFRHALEAGADGIEFDVRLARDLVPVVIHDPDLKRTALREGRVADLSSIELARVDAGTWFNLKHPARARHEYAGTGVPTLAEVFEMTDAGSARLYVELKCEASETGPLARAVSELICARGALERSVVKSFRLDAIREVKRLNSSIRTAALFERSLSRSAPSARRMIERALECGADEISLHRTLVRAHLVDHALKVGMRVVVWTVDDSRWAERARSLGLHALITNDPALLRSALDGSSGA